MKPIQPPPVAPQTTLICTAALCSGESAQTNGILPETPHGKPTVKRGFRTVRRAVILSILVILLILWVAAKPLEAWWIGRSTATSWMLWWSPLTSPPESSAVHVSITLPDDRRPKANEPFVLTVGLGTHVNAAEETVLTIHAPGFDITDMSGTTVSDVYTREIPDFDHERYGMVSTQNRLERVWKIEKFHLCGYTEDFTFTWRGELPATAPTDFGISASLHASIGFADTKVYYTAQKNRIKLSTDRPRVGCGSGQTELTPVVTDEMDTGINRDA